MPETKAPCLDRSLAGMKNVTRPSVGKAIGGGAGVW